MLRWITSKYGDLVPLAVFITVLGGVYVIDRQQSNEPLSQQRQAEDQATRQATLIASQIQLALDERISAGTAEALRFTPVEDSISQRTLTAALDTVTARFAGLSSISAIFPDGTIVLGSNALLGTAGTQLDVDTIVGNPYRRVQTTRQITASGVARFGPMQRVFVFNPVMRADSQVIGYLVSEIDPQSVVSAAQTAAQDSITGTLWTVLGPSGEPITAVSTPQNWRTVDRTVPVGDSHWTVRFAYQPVDLRLFRTQRIATWVIGIVVALALAAILLFLRQTIGRQREEITRRQVAEEAARTSATEARERAREARELAVQLEAAQRASQRLSTLLDPDSVVELFLGGVAEILEADVASLYTFEEEGEVLVGRRRIIFRNVGEVTERLKGEDIRQVRAPVALLPSIAEAVSTGEPHVEIGRLVARGRPAAAVTAGSDPAALTVTIPLQIAGHMVGVASWEVYSEAREFEPRSDRVCAGDGGTGSRGAAYGRAVLLARGRARPRAARSPALRRGARPDGRRRRGGRC